MRTKLLLAGAAIGLATLVGPVGHALAQEAEPELTHEAEECIELLEEGKDVDACQEAPSPILPETNEIIWGTISFVIVLVALGKFAVPALRKGMAARADRIRADLGSAETAKTDAQTVLQQYEAQLADARNEAARIIEEARRSADSVKRDLVARAEAEIADVRARAASDLQAARSQALADLRTEVASIAIGAAEMIVEETIDRDQAMRLVDRYIEQVGSRS